MPRKKKVAEEEPLVEMKEIHIETPSKRVIGRLKKGHKVQLKKGDRPIHVFSTRHDAITKAFLKGRGIHLALHPHEVRHNMGKGFFDFLDPEKNGFNAALDPNRNGLTEIVNKAAKVIENEVGAVVDPNRNGVTKALLDVGADIQNKVLNPLSAGMAEFGDVMERTVGPAIVNGLIDVAKEGGNIGLDVIRDYGGEIVGGALVALCAATGQVELMPLAAAAGAAVGKWATGLGTEAGKKEIEKYLDAQKMNIKKPSANASDFEKATYNMTQQAVRMARDSLEDELFKSDKYTKEQKDALKARKDARKKKEEDEDKLVDQAAIDTIQKQQQDEFNEQKALADRFESENKTKAEQEQKKKAKRERLTKKDFIRILNKYTGQRMNALKDANRAKAEANALTAKLAAEAEARKKALIPKLDYSGAVPLAPYTDPVPISNVGQGIKSHDNIEMPKKGEGFAEDIGSLGKYMGMGLGGGAGLYASVGRGMSRHAGLIGVGGNLLHHQNQGVLPPALQSQPLSQNFQWKSRLGVSALVGKGMY